MRGLRLLAASGAALFTAGWFAGWFTLVPAATGIGERVVRPGGVLGGVLPWVALVLLLVALLAPSDRRWLRLAVPAVVPALLVVALAGGLAPREVVDGETLGEVVRDRVLGQALSVTGALIALMATVTAWRRAGDWRVPHRWWSGEAAASVPARPPTAETS